MAQKQKIFIPTFISSIDYKPARVLPHVYFYNGTKESDSYFIEGYASGSTSSVTQNEITFFPYFDNYSGNTPTSSSFSLLFNNETAPYGEAPTGSLYSEYWETYVNLLYNPKTRLFDCSAIIPLADYFKMELNDVVEWRGNYYHLRAINNYNLANGECQIQLLGPVIGDVIAHQLPGIPCAFDYSIEDYTESFTTNYSMSMCPEAGATSFGTYEGSQLFSISGSGTGSAVASGVSPISFSVSGDSPWPSSTLLIATASLNGTPIYSGSTSVSSSVLSFSTSSKDGDVFDWNTTTICGYTPPVTSSGYLIEDCETGLTQYYVSFAATAPPTNHSFVSSELGVGCWKNVSSVSGVVLDYTNVVRDNDYTTCADCLTPSSCRTYVNETSNVWQGDYYDCVTSQWVFNAIVYPYSSICAGDGTPHTISGTDLTRTTACNL